MVASPALTAVTPILNPPMNPPLLQPYTHSQGIVQFLLPFSFPNDNTRALEGDFFSAQFPEANSRAHQENVGEKENRSYYYRKKTTTLNPCKKNMKPEKTI
jgi:hypothetical protein